MSWHLLLRRSAKVDGGICLNKWDICRQNPYFVGPQMGAGFPNIPNMRVADVILMLAEVKAGLDADTEAIGLVNQIRERAFGDDLHNISGLSVKH
ncbi:MAG: RagB/SusD family nutrient uptake outer membrane protein [Bacteroides cellulosilyticus]